MGEFDKQRGIPADRLGQLRPTMADPAEIPRDRSRHAIVPGNDRLKLSYQELAPLLGKAQKQLAEFPGQSFDFGDIGYLPVVLTLHRKELHYRILECFSDTPLEGSLKNIGFNTFAVMDKETGNQHHAGEIIKCLRHTLEALVKMEMLERAPFPGGAIDQNEDSEVGAGGSTGGHAEHPDKTSHRQFVGDLMSRSRKIFIHPDSLASDFHNYQIYEIPCGDETKYVAYNPSYGKAVYISPNLEDFFRYSKMELRRMDHIDRVCRHEDVSPERWQKRVWDCALGEPVLLS